MGGTEREQELRWAQGVAAKGKTPELRAIGRAIVGLERLDEVRRADLVQRAHELVASGPTDTHRRAGQAILTLAEGLAAAPPTPAPTRTVPEQGPRATTAARAPRARTRRGRPALPRRVRLAVPLAAGVVAVSLLALGGIAGARAALAPQLSAAGPAANARLGAAALVDLVFTVRAGRPALASERWTLDGRDVTARVRPEGTLLVLRPGALADGAHTVEIAARRSGFLGSSRVRRFPFVVDTVPPSVRFPRPPAISRAQSLQLTGLATGAERVLVGGQPAKLDGDRFSLDVAAPVPAALKIVAVDAAGNRAAKRVKVALIPRRPDAPVRAVHVTAYGWADDGLRAGIMALIDQHRINAVELDLKDEGGLIGFAAAVPLARRIGAEQHVYDLAAAVRQLHARGVRVIGRVVCFRDPVLAGWAWKQGRRDLVVQTPGGGPYSGYGGFTNFANAEVEQYQIDIGLAGARAGVDDVLYDYVRRPDGPISSMRFPGLQGTPEQAIVSFLRRTRLALAPYGTYLGASVFGVAATRPKEVAQDIPQMAREVDYIAPMVYPSHWGPGEYGIADPNGQPYDIVKASLADFRKDAAGSGARIVPWLQDFSLGRTYGPTEVRAQIEAAAADGISEFILWDAAVTYTAAALSTDAPAARVLAKAVRTQPAKPTPEKPTATTTTATATAKPKATLSAAGVLPPNELGQIPVLMHHEIRPDRVGEYDQTPAEFRAELEQLWTAGYYPVRAVDLVERKLDRVPAGKTPVVMTFDDSTQFQFRYTNGKIDPTTAIGVMLDFARTHPGFEPAGTFYVLRSPFAGTARGPAMLRWLVAHGFELGNHTHDHLPLRTLSATDVQKELVQGERVITKAVPGYAVRTMALPLGSMPVDPKLAGQGRWEGGSYRNEGVFLVGANPAPSPYASGWDPLQIPRIRSSHLPYDGAEDLTAAYWLRELERHPEQRYVSDGDAARITFPAAERDQLAPRFRRLADPV